MIMAYKRKYPKAGQPRVFLDKTKEEHFFNALRLGLSRCTACKIIGIHPSTVKNEADRNPEFLERLKEAEGGCEQALAAMIYQAAKGGQWTAAAWMLERKWRKRWGRQPNEQVIVHNTMPSITFTPAPDA